MADAVERNLPKQVLLLPVLWMGASEHHLPFGGTLTASLSTYELMLMELLTPAPRWVPADPALERSRREHRPAPDRAAAARCTVSEAVLTGAAYWELAEAEIAALCEGPRKTMGHACEIETSMIMHLRPELVRKDLILDDPDPDAGTLGSLTWARDFGRRTDHGAVGYPEAANADRGRRMLEAIGREGHYGRGTGAEAAAVVPRRDMSRKRFPRLRMSGISAHGVRPGYGSLLSGIGRSLRRAVP